VVEPNETADRLASVVVAKKAARKVVRAAGGVVWRRRPAEAGEEPRARRRWLARRREAHDDAGDIEVVLIHRPDYDDWSLPKGKPDGDETAEETAHREVEEETGLTCQLGPELASTRYVDGKGRDKVVRYWAMTVEQQRDRQPDDEVDEWRWVELDEAEAMLTYPHDRSVLASLRGVRDHL
jgi:8-oxo-dGTP diphosphatase